MFIGHFAAGFAARKLAPRPSLGTLFLAAQFIDLLWPTLLLLGLEHVRIMPGATAVAPLLFESYPISHSLLMVVLWGAGFGAVHFALKREARSAIVLGLLVVSHWVLDFITHQPDLPLMPGGGPKVGLNLWASLPLSLAVESVLFFGGVWIYARATEAVDKTGRWAFLGLVVFLYVMHIANIFGAPPPNVTALAWFSQLQWLLVIWGYWIDRHRRTRVTAP